MRKQSKVEEGKRNWFYTLERLTSEESFIKIQYNFFLELTFALDTASLMPASSAGSADRQSSEARIVLADSHVASSISFKLLVILVTVIHKQP